MFVFLHKVDCDMQSSVSAPQSPTIHARLPSPFEPVALACLFKYVSTHIHIRVSMRSCILSKIEYSVAISHEINFAQFPLTSIGSDETILGRAVWLPR